MIVPGVSLDEEVLGRGYTSASRAGNFSPALVVNTVIGSKAAIEGSTRTKTTAIGGPVTGGTTLLYMTPPASVRGLGLRPLQYIIPAPVSPLLGLGFGLNLAVLGAEYLGLDALTGPRDPITGGDMVY